MRFILCDSVFDLLFGLSFKHLLYFITAWNIQYTHEYFIENTFFSLFLCLFICMFLVDVSCVYFYVYSISFVYMAKWVRQSSRMNIYFIVYFRNIYLIVSIILISKRVLFIGDLRSSRLDFFIWSAFTAFSNHLLCMCICSISALAASVPLAPSLFLSYPLCICYLARFQCSTYTYIVPSYLYNSLRNKLKKMSKNQISQIKHSWNVKVFPSIFHLVLLIPHDFFSIYSLTKSFCSISISNISSFQFTSTELQYLFHHISVIYVHYIQTEAPFPSSDSKKNNSFLAQSQHT